MIEQFVILGLLVALALPIAGIVLGAMALIQTRGLKARFEELDLRQPQPEAWRAPEPRLEPAPPAVEPRAERAAPAPEPPAPPAVPEVPPLAVLPRAPRGRRLEWERRLAENWLVWLGGIALALGGAFLVKLSIDYGLLTPMVRDGLGVLLGMALAAAAEAVMRRDRAREDDARPPSNVPQALAAAGAATVFASLYAAYQLNGLLPAELDFALLAATAAMAVLMSWRYGPFVAALGLLGALTVPLLVPSDRPNALTLFAYLTVVTAAGLTVLRHKSWWWLAWLSLAGSIGWTLLWLAFSYASGDAPVVGGFLLIQMALYAGLRRGVGFVAFLAGPIDDPHVAAILRTAFWSLAAALLLLATVDGFAETSVIMLLLATLGILGLAFRDGALDDLLAAAGALPLAMLALWGLPGPGGAFGMLPGGAPPERAGEFLFVAAGFALLLGIGGFAALSRVARPARWAALSASAPLALLAIAYLRLESYHLDLAWMLAALLLAMLELAAGERVARRRAGSEAYEAALAAYAIAVPGATILAATMMLETAWLTVALAVHLPVMAWAEERFRLPAIRRAALALASAVLVRLVLNPEIFSYPLSPTPILNWLLYGYGVPALAFIYATRSFARSADDLLVRVLEAGSAAFSVALVTLELRHALNGGVLDLASHGLASDSVETLAWLAMAGAILRLGERHGRKVLVAGGLILLALATAKAVIWQGIVLNPLLPFRTAPVGALPLLDTLAPAYLLPGILYALIARYSPGPPPEIGKAARVLSGAFLLLWLTAEVRHLFQGEILTWSKPGEAEWYSYSVAWLAFASAALAAGLVRKSRWLRRAALAGIGLVVVKVFLSDMAELGGIWRVLSFIGLGGALIAIGWFYRRLEPSPEEAET